LLVADRRSGRRVGPAVLAWIALAALSYVPLAIHELGADASELRAAIAFVAGGGGSTEVALPVRLVIVLVRVVSWPLSGLLTDAPLAAILATGAVIAIVAWRGWLDRSVETDERTAVRWLGLGLAWTIAALAIAAPSLATIVPGLPNDHYHAFADPIVVALVGIGAAAAIRHRVVIARAAGAAGVVAVAAFNLVTQPPAVAPDGGWQAARAAAERVARAIGTEPFALASLPPFKSDEALRMPLETLGLEPIAVEDVPQTGSKLIVICDQLFHDAIGAGCGGPAEDAKAGPSPTLIDRVEAAPGRWISIYEVTPDG
jgi:hypothetical protein